MPAAKQKLKRTWSTYHLCQNTNPIQQKMPQDTTPTRDERRRETLTVWRAHDSSNNSLTAHSTSSQSGTERVVWASNLRVRR